MIFPPYLFNQNKNDGFKVTDEEKNAAFRIANLSALSLIIMAILIKDTVLAKGEENKQK